MKLSKAIAEVKAWNERFGHIPEEDDLREDLWRNDWEFKELAFDLVDEEVSELEQAMLCVEGTMFYPSEESKRFYYRPNDVETLDALVDILVTVFGIAAKSGLDEIIEPAFKEVMRSNWSKLDEEGNPVYLSSGKIGKSELYEAPNLRQFFDEEELEDE